MLEEYKGKFLTNDDKIDITQLTKVLEEQKGFSTNNDKFDITRLTKIAKANPIHEQLQYQ